MSDKKEHNYVADAQNWGQRIKGEINAARVCNIMVSTDTLQYLLLFVAHETLLLSFFFIGFDSL
jgi:hypothetical protein